MVQVRLTYREPRIIGLEPSAPDSLKKREPNFVMIASRGADKCKPLQVGAGCSGRQAGMP
jgi:hypothetical protein